MSSSTKSVHNLPDASRRWGFDTAHLQSWRQQMMTIQTTPAPTPAQLQTPHDPTTREAFLEQLRLQQLAAEERVRKLQEKQVDQQLAAATAALSIQGGSGGAAPIRPHDCDDEEDDSDSCSTSSSSSSEDDEEKETNGVDPTLNDDAMSSSSEDESEDERNGEYANELEYFAFEILCLDAINHNPPTGKEVQCTYCQDGKKFESEFSCSSCAFVRGVCATCRKVVVLRTLADPAKGAAVCLALISDEALLKSTFEIEDEEELEAIQGQITFMLDAYFDKS